jgi:hypothetical protein
MGGGGDGKRRRLGMGNKLISWTRGGGCANDNKDNNEMRAHATGQRRGHRMGNKAIIH